MEIIIGERLREMRAQRGNTQDDLARHLGISVQAVSKWERAEGYPDITLLPAIAAFYGVSVDDLLGSDEVRKKERLEDYFTRRRELANKGKVSEEIALCREALRLFPNELRLISALMYALSASNDSSYHDEIIALGERILRESNDNGLREGAVQCLCYTQNSMGNKEEAKRYAEMAGSLYVNEGALLCIILDGEEGVVHCQNHLTHLIDLAAQTVETIMVHGNYTTEQKIHMCESVLALYEWLFDDGNYLFYHMRVSYNCMRIARLYAGEQKREQALDYIGRAAEHAIAFDQMQENGGGKYTSLLLDHFSYESSSLSKNHSSNDAMECLCSLDSGCFDFLREDAEFCAIADRLRACAKE